MLKLETNKPIITIFLVKSTCWAISNPKSTQHYPKEQIVNIEDENDHFINEELELGKGHIFLASQGDVSKKLERLYF